VASPRAPRLVVARPRLLGRLDSGTPLTLLHAPTGFGKTTLVRQWLAGRGTAAEAVAGVRVRPNDGDPAAFWIAVVDALTDVGLSPPRLAAQRSPQGMAERMLDTLDRPLTVWVDNFENVAGSRIGEVLVDLAGHVPELRLIITQRDEEHVADRWSTDLEVTTIGPEDLVLTSDETRALLTLTGASITADAVDLVQAELGGWPEPTRSLAMALADGSPADLAALTASTAAAFLRRLLPASTQGERVDFAHITAVPDEFSARMGERLTDDPSAKAHLEWLVGQGLLIVVPVDGEPRYRWPAAARRRLTADLAARSPERLVDVHERLAQWYVDAGEPARSLRHAVAAADWPLVLETTRDWWRPVLIEHSTELRAAARAVPPEVANRSPVGTTMRAVRAVLLHVDDEALYERATLPAEPAELDRLAARAEAGDLVDDGLAVLLAMEAARPGEPVRRHAERLLHLASAAQRHHGGAVAALYPAVQLQVGLVRLAAGDISSASTCLLAAYEDDEAPVGRASAAAALALARACAGEPGEAELWLSRYDADPAPDNPLAASRRAAELARLLVALDRLDLVGAVAAAGRLTAGAHRFRALELAARATLALHVDRPSDLLAEVDEARAAPGPESPFGSALIAAAEADLLLALGRANRVQAVLDGPSKAHPLLRPRQARLALLAGDNETAVALAGDTDWERRAGRRERLEMLLIQAVAHARRGDRAEARSLVGGAVEAAGPTGLWAPFTTVPRADLEELAGPVLASGPLANARAVFPPLVDVVRLTRREHEVLGRIAAGLSMHEVASALHVSYSTVRTQQRSLYRKLGARSRGEAVARARQFALLQEPSN
jgi:LuxR family maltose regulon positive regulatory protein